MFQLMTAGGKARDLLENCQQGSGWKISTQLRPKKVCRCAMGHNWIGAGVAQLQRCTQY